MFRTSDLSSVVVSRFSERDSSDCSDVFSVNERDLTVAGIRVHDTVVDDVIGLGKKVLHKVMRPEDGPFHSGFLHLLLDLVMPNADRSL